MTDRVMLTAFPRLLHTVRDDNQANSTYRDSFWFDNAEINQERFIRAWGCLLHGYTLESIVTFLVVDKSTMMTVAYDSSTKNFEVHKAPNGIDENQGTVIGFGTQELPPLEVSMNVISGGLVLQLSCANFSVDFSSILFSQIFTILKHSPVTDPMDKFDPVSVLNCPNVKIDGPRLLHHLPDYSSTSVAVEFYNQDGTVSTMTYDELNRISSVLARKISAKSTTESKIIPILIPPGPAMYVGVLGVLRAGKAFCPLAQEDTPRDRLQFIITDIKADVLLVTSESAEMVVGMEIETVFVSIEDLKTEEFEGFEEDNVVGDDIAYCMFTSGSTGRPKGVLVTHTNATQAILAHEFVPPFQRFLNFASLTFDVAVLEIFLPWYRGVTLVSAHRPLLLSNLTHVINRTQVDAAELTPTVASILKQEEVPSLTSLITIGETLTSEVIKQFGTPGRFLYNTYGPTEATIQCTGAIDGTFHNFVEADIGVPLKTTGAIIVDAGIQDQIKPLPVGWAGELVLSGSQVATGYLNRLELTESVFLNDDRYGHCYRTGDLARILPNGRILFIGRIFDEQVKIRGRRIELGEIENVCGNGAVACVLQSRIVVVTLGDVNDARRSAQRLLPGYMIPNKILRIDKIPLLASGKTDRKRIYRYVEESLKERNDSDEFSHGYASVVESTLAHAVHEVVGILPGPEVSLRSIGIDSVGAMRVVSQARGVLYSGASICVADILVHDTIRQISLSCVTEMTRRHEGGQIRNLRNQYGSEYSLSDDVIGVYPTTPLQQSMLFESMRDARLYSNVVRFLVKNETSSDRIIDGIRTVIDANEILRTGFLATNDDFVFVQIVYADSRHLKICGDPMEKFMFHDMRFPPLRIRINKNDSYAWLVDVVIHHALYDGWTFDMFLQQLESAIFARETTKDCVQFREVMPYILDSGSSSIDFWKEYLRNSRTHCLPTLMPPRSHSPESFVDKLSVDIHVPLMAELSSKFKVSAQSVFQLAWAHVLSGLFVPDDEAMVDVVFGTLVSQRTALAGRALDSGFGPMFATLPFRVSYQPSGITIAEILEKLSRNALSVMRHAGVRFSEIVKLLPHHSVGTACSANLGSLFAWQQSVYEKCENIILVGGIDRLEFEILLEVEPVETQFRLALTYHAPKISKSHAETLLRQVESLATVIVEFAEDDISILTKVIYSDCDLAISNPQPRELNDRKTAMDLIDCQSDNIAIQILQENSTVRQIRYRELGHLTAAYTSFLQRHGIRHGDFVAVVMMKSIELYAVITAIWALGAAYVPLDESTPVARINSVMKETQSPLCCVSKRIRGLDLQLEIPDYSTLPICNDSVKVNSSVLDIAYVIFTSGSSGKPKGIQVSHQNLVNNILQLSELYPAPKEGSKLLQLCSIGFDVSIFDIVYCLHHHMTLFSAPREVIFPCLSQLIRDHSITHLSMTATVASLLDAALVRNVECVVLAGESITPATLKFWENLPVTVIDAYGPSEMTNVCTAFIDKKFGDDIANIGLPFPNTSCFVLAPGGTKFVPIGSVGELAFGGYQVAAGYLNSQKVTAEKFIDLRDYGKVYRTGDWGRMMADGSIVFLGRMDQQIKVRGQRVDLDEINAVAVAVPRVKQCVTIFVDDSLVSFFVAGGNDLHLELKLRNALEAALPTYMVPSDIIAVDEMPMNANGKVDKEVLTALLAMHTEVGDNLVDDLVVDVGTQLEQFFADIFAQSVRSVSSPKIRLDTPLFRYGLDSISAIRFTSLLRTNRYNVSISDVLHDATIRSIVQKYYDMSNNVLDTSVGSEKIKIFATDVKSYVSSAGLGSNIECILPCTAIQDAILCSHESYTNSFLLKLADDVDVLRVKHAWESIASSREILRTTFVEVGSNSMSRAFAQVVVKCNQLQWQDVQVKQYGEMLDFLRSMKFTIQPANCPYLLTLFSGICGHYLCVSMHHSLFDGYALDLLLLDVVQAYNGQPVAQRTSVCNAIENIESVDTSPGVSYFADILQGHEGLLFPKLSTSTVAEAGTRDAKLCSKFSVSVFESAVKEAGTTISAAVQTAWAKLLSLVSGTNDVLFGSIAGGRGAFPGSEDVVGPIFSSYLVRANLSSSSTNVEILRQLEHLEAEAVKYQFTPIREVLKKVAAKKSGTDVLFDSVLILQYIQSYGNGFDNEIWTCVEEGNDSGDLSLILEIRRKQQHDVLEYFMEYKGSLLDEPQANLLLDTFDRILLDVIHRPESKVFDFTTFSSSQLSISPAPTRLTNQGSTYLHSAFEANAIGLANQTALEFLHKDDQIQKWSYSELNRVADQLASYLCHVCTVQVEDSVPICILKSPELYRSILATLKVGAAFCPIDPLMPQRRISYMLQELRARIILVNNDSEERLRQIVGTEHLGIHIVNISKLVFNDVDIMELDRKLPDDSITAYRIFTSGTTGKPKAVEIEVRSAVQAILASKHLIPYNSKTRLLQYASPSFDMSIYDCFIAWSFGLTLCATSQEIMKTNLEEVINKLGVTLLDLTPTVASTIRRVNVPSVEWLYSIGEILPQSLACEWDGACVNSYGPTEASMCCTITQVSKETRSTIIGHPFPTTSFYILNPASKDIVPILSAGELCIGGHQIARGYYLNETITAKNFIRLSAIDSPIFRTGDLARMLTDGAIEFIGRKDDQVKIRGVRIDLQEINSVIHRQAATNCLFNGVCTSVMRQPTEWSRPQIVSFIASKTAKDSTDCHLLKTTDSIDSLLRLARDACLSFLPHYMVPNAIIPISNMPLSTAGKVSKTTLQIVYQKFSSVSTSLSGETTAHNLTRSYATIREVFAAVSGISTSHILPDTTLYQLGLDSISAVRIASQLACSGLHCTAIDVLRCQTMERLAKFVKDKTVANNDDLAGSFEQENLYAILRQLCLDETAVAHVYPCTHTQEGILSQFQATTGRLYMNHIVFEIPNSVVYDGLFDAWMSVVQKYEIWRTGFWESDTETTFSYAQVIYKDPEFQWRRSKLSTSIDLTEFVDERVREYSRHAIKHLHLPQLFLEYIDVQDGCSRYLLLVANHAIFDAQSLNMTLSEVSGLLKGTELTDKHSSNRDVLNSILSLQLSATGNSASRFWKSRLSAASITRMPNLNPFRADDVDMRTVERQLSFTFERLQQSCSKLSVSVQTAGAATWAKLLSLYTGEPEVVFGMVLSGRTGVESASSSVFPCLTTVPFHVPVSGLNSELLAAVEQHARAILEFQHTPHQIIREIVGFPELLYDSVFLYQKVPKQPNMFDWKKLVDDGATEYTCSVEIEPLCNGYVSLRLHFNMSVMPTRQATLILQQFDHTLRELLTLPNRDCLRLDMPMDVLSIVPPKLDEIPSDIKLLHEFVERRAQLTPDAIALEFATVIEEERTEIARWSYAELNRQANKVANFILSTFAVQPNDIIITCFEKSPEASFVFVGILKAGCSFLAIDITAPISRKRYIALDSGAKFVLTNDKLLEQSGTKEMNIPIVVIAPETIADSPETPPFICLHPQDLCYCLYTSGSTGNPKGCMLTHENAVQGMLAFQRQFEDTCTAGSRFLQFASFHFDVSVLEQFWSWSIGITVSSAPRDVILRDLNLTINAMGITHIDLTPSLAALLIPDEVPSLCRGLFITGGDLLNGKVLEAWADKKVIYNAYGPTEVTIGCTMRKQAPNNIRPSNIGQQFDNVGTSVVLIGTDIPVPKGAIGELCVSGKLVGNGYIRRPDLTAQNFVHSEKLGTKMYRTGDLVRLLHDLSFDFIGRKDTQVKLRGQRLDMGEVNSVIKQSSETVRDVITLILENTSNHSDQLVSFIKIATDVSTDGLLPASPSTRSLVLSIFDFCKSKLPLYMVPTYILPLRRIPLSINNKIDNAALGKLYTESTLDKLGSYSEESFGAESWNTVELKLREQVISLVPSERSNIGPGVTFFELGFDSISLVGLHKRLRKLYDRLSLSALMRFPSIRLLAEHIIKDDGFINRVSAPQNCQLLDYHQQAWSELDLDPEDIEYIIPCTPLQEGIISRALRSEDDILYFNKFFFELYEEVDTLRLQQCWNAVVQQNQALRASFFQTKIGIAQVILKEWEPVWLDYTKTIGDYRQQANDLLIEHWKNVKLSRPPLVFSVMSTAQSRLLFIGIFHALYDASSLQTILDDVVKLYFYIGLQDRPSFVEAIYRIQSSIDFTAAKEFWTENFSCMEIKQLPKLQKSASASASALIHRGCCLPYSKVQEAARNLCCTPQVLLQAAFVISLARLLGTALSFGIVVSGRSYQDDLDNVAGPLFNTLPLAVDMSTFRSYRDIVCTLQQYSGYIMDHMHTPLRMIRKWLNISADVDLFSALFVFQKVSFAATENSLWIPIPSGEYIADYPICFEVQCSDELINLTLGYLRTYVDDNLARSFLDDVDIAVSNIATQPDCAADISCLDKQVFSNTHSQCSNLDILRADETAADADVLQKIRRAVANIAKIKEETVNDDISIMSFGLDSIDAIRLSSVLFREEKIDLPMTTILKHPSVRSMAQALSNTTHLRLNEKPASNICSAKCALEKAASYIYDDCEDVYYCTPLQDGILTESLSSENALYLNHDVLLIKEHVDFDRLKSAFLVTLNANPIYRSKFVALDTLLTCFPSHFGMAVLKDASVNFDYKLIHDSTWASELQSIVDNISRSINPFKSPPVHLQIIESETKRAILLTISHALYDGHSIGLLFDDIVDVYEHSTPPLRPHFGPLLSRIIAESQDASHISYWQEHMVNSNMEDFPDLDYTTNGTDRAILVCRAEIPSRLSPQQLSTFAKENGITFQTIGQTCWAVLLSYYVGLSDVVFGTVLSGRTTEEDEQVQFPSMVTIPTRASIRGCFSSMLRSMQGYMNSSRDHQYTALSSIFQAVSAGRRLFHTLFLYQRRDTPTHNLWHSIDGWSAVEYSVAAELERLPDAMTWRVAIKSSKAGQKSAEALVQQLDAILRQMLKSPESSSYCGSPVDIGEELSLSSLVDVPYSVLWHMIDDTTIGRSNILEEYANEENLRVVCMAENQSRMVWRGCVGELCIVEDVKNQIKLIPTGVRARVLASGDLKYAGLVKDVVSFDCNTVDLEKISRAVCGCSTGIAKALSLIVKSAGKDIIVTFIAGNSEQEDGVAFAFRRARKLLAEKLLPSYIIPLKSISLIDEDISDENMLLESFLNMRPKALEPFTQSTVYCVEWSSLELALRKVLTLVSGIDEGHIRKTDSIFHLGLDSISCIKLSSLLRDQSIFLSVSEIVACESVEAMAQLVELNQSKSITTTRTLASAVSIQHYLDKERLKSEFGIADDMIQTVLPATPGQVYMLSGWQTSQDVGFMSTFCYCSELLLDESTIESGWSRLLQSCPILRTTFIATDSDDIPILQIILRPECVKNTFSCSTSFDPKSDAVFEKVPVHLHIAGRKIYLTIHHALYDAWSLRMILASLSELCLDETKSDINWSNAARDEFIFRTKFTESKRIFWISQLRGASIVTDAPPVYTVLRNGEFQQDCLVSAPKISSYCREQGFSISSLLFAAYALVYHREVLRSTSHKVVFGVYNSGRTENIAGLSDLAFPTVNVHPLVVYIRPSLTALAHDIHKKMLEISKESRSQVSLFDIKRWTGVSINSAVNFLEGVGDTSQRRISVFDHVSDETADTKRVSHRGQQLAHMLDHNLAKDAMNINVDVELSLLNNKLNVGVFYIASALNGCAGKDIIAEFTAILEDELAHH
ncbi:hypothetical protein V1525DRAFT_434800 [Lipomyces kononenkoae]|uniref:Uncharacterized protein n=1 Tax=Lipomyces kononenkoae TaxID=34357 RepID=A0ACC3SUL4_LIPKO